MKAALFAVSFLALTGCRALLPPPSPAEESRIIESTILWEAKLDPVTWEPYAMTKLLRNFRRFKRMGNFYEAKDGTMAFGHEVIYLGLLGIELVPGPNATLKGKSSEVADYIGKHHNIKFSENDGEYQAELRKHIVLCVAPHPSLEDTSMVIGAYLGP